MRLFEVGGIARVGNCLGLESGPLILNLDHDFVREKLANQMNPFAGFVPVPVLHGVDERLFERQVNAEQVMRRPSSPA
jgi:hypothetical protein